ncbi:MAG: class II glutamine amidotransferase [Halomonas sp.]|nr:class II glutamine amidotransferase [Halomonas sp.]
MERKAAKTANTSPFMRELNGRGRCFSHNGNLAHLRVGELLAASCRYPVWLTSSLTNLACRSSKPSFPPTPDNGNGIVKERL